MNTAFLHALDVTEITYVHKYDAPSEHYPMHNRGRYRHCFCYTVEGAETYHFADGSIRAVPDSVFYIPQGEEYRITLEGSRSVAYTLDFALPDNAPQSRPFLVRFDKTNAAKSCFAEAEKTWMRKRENHDVLLKSLFYKIVSVLIEGGGAAFYGHFAKIGQSVAYLSEHYTENDFRLDSLYAMAGISAKYYTTLFRERFGMTPKEYVTLLRIEYAKGLLASEKTKIEDVALAAGYSDVYHFSKMFKAKTGYTPTAYKRQMPEEENE